MLDLGGENLTFEDLDLGLRRGVPDEAVAEDSQVANRESFRWYSVCHKGHVLARHVTPLDKAVVRHWIALIA